MGAIHIGARSVYGSVDEPPTGLTSRLLILATHPIPKCEQPSTTDIWPTTRHRLFSGFQVDTLVEFCRLLDRTIITPRLFSDRRLRLPRSLTVCRLPQLRLPAISYCLPPVFCS